MIKGVCKQIIEVADTGNDCFERALFFVNPGFSDIERAALEKEARQILHRMSVPLRTQYRKRALRFWIRIAFSGVMGTILGILAGLFLFGGV